MEFDYLQSAFERALNKVAGQSFCNPKPRTIEQLTALLDAKIEKHKQNNRQLDNQLTTN